MLGYEESDNVVSIAIATYNHERYISQAIESVLMQKVNFKYEIVIAEDCSTDSTRQIILEYKKKYPSKIILILQDMNVGMQENGYELLNACSGEYIAFLDGDDYWTDEDKLQKQIEFLKRNSEYSGVYHNVTIVDELSNVRNDFAFPYFEEHTVDFGEYIEELGAIGQTGSLVCRNFWTTFSDNEKIFFYDCIANGDQKISLELILQGKVFYMPDVMSNYRRVIGDNDSWTAKTYEKNISRYCYFSRKELIEYAFNRKRVIISNLVLEKVIVSAAMYAIKKPTKENIKIAKEIINDYGHQMKLLREIFKRCFKKVFYKKK